MIKDTKYTYKQILFFIRLRIVDVISSLKFLLLDYYSIFAHNTGSRLSHFVSSIILAPHDFGT
ncbi:hypothetical protein LV84_03976 [Algoriphagus ratkowskyi]|uniref:Uncharacterized protein n=1 Tax=Algoriphagus ratkowskyi TaxID=57028 RepID=A0A2W7QQQ0_9BACT|nr:hypothetical protein LV84_03976 [Algoriphagus ratkowskyi]